MNDPDNAKLNPTPANIEKLQGGGSIQQLPGQDPRTMQSASFYDRLTANVSHAIKMTAGVGEVTEDLSEGQVSYVFVGDGNSISVVLTNHG